jgi:hypothetical protein
LGTNGSTILQIINEIGGTNRTVRIRIRGIGSGFLEGPTQQELQEPLHFNVSAENDELLQKALERVKTHVFTIQQQQLQHLQQHNQQQQQQQPPNFIRPPPPPPPQAV